MHVIRKASLEVNCAGKTDAFALNRDAADWANAFLLPQLDQVLAGLPDCEEHVSIDRLDIELNAAAGMNWGEDILPKLKSELLAKLLPALLPGISGPEMEKLSAAEGFF